jgi:hypothetical protein
MAEYNNKLFLLRSGIPYYHLAGPERTSSFLPEKGRPLLTRAPLAAAATPDRAGVFYVYNFDPSLRTGDIVRHFTSFGRVFVNWVDDTSLFVTLADKTLAPRVPSLNETLASPFWRA